MLDFVCIFTTGGVLLWHKTFLPDFNLSLINLFIKTCLLEEHTTKDQKAFRHQEHTLKWQLNSSVKLVFLVVYKEILQLQFVEQLLDMMGKAFIGSVLPTIPTTEAGIYIVPGGEDIFSRHYELVYQKWDETCKI